MKKKGVFAWVKGIGSKNLEEKSGGCSSGHWFRCSENRVRAHVEEEAAGSVPEEAGAPGVRSIPGKGVCTWKGGIGSRYYGFCV